MAEACARAWANRDPEKDARFRAMVEQQQLLNDPPVTAAEIRDLSNDDLTDRLVGRVFAVASSDIGQLRLRPALLRAWYTTKHFEGEVMTAACTSFS